MESAAAPDMGRNIDVENVIQTGILLQGETASTPSTEAVLALSKRLNQFYLSWKQRSIPKNSSEKRWAGGRKSRRSKSPSTKPIVVANGDKAGYGPRINKGVYRFNSHEEADQWLMKHLTTKQDR